jgi:hypothetical protein
MQTGISGSSGTGREGEPPFPPFSAILLPHRSLSRKGFVAPMLAAGPAARLSESVVLAERELRVTRNARELELQYQIRLTVAQASFRKGESLSGTVQGASVRGRSRACAAACHAAARTG